MSVDLYTLGRIALGGDDPLIPKFVGAALSAAQAIKYEAASTTNHTARLAWAATVERATDDELKTIARIFIRKCLISSSAISSKGSLSTDADITNAFNTHIDSVALEA